MKLFRTMLMTAALWASAQFAHVASAQSLSAVSLQALAAEQELQSPYAFSPYLAAGFVQDPTPLALQPECPAAGFSFRSWVGCCPSACPVMGQNSWVNHVLQQSMFSWQRLGAVCGRGEMTCPTAGVAVGVACCKTSCCTSAAPGCAKGGDAVQAQKCCCAKACACCESCTPPKADLRYDQASYPRQAFVQVEPPPGANRCPFVLPPPAPPVWAPMPNQVQMQNMRLVLPVPGASMPKVIALPSSSPMAAQFQVVRSVPVSVPQVQRAHLATPDFDVRGDRMTYKGDLVMVEGNVHLVCVKQGRPMVIEAQRIMLNVRDGSFTVETDVRPQSGTFGIMRTSALEAPTFPGVTVYAVPTQRVQVPAPTNRETAPAPINWRQGLGQPFAW